MYIVHHLILLRPIPLTLVLIEKDGNFSTMSKYLSNYELRIWLSAEGAQTFPAPSYVISEDGVIWLRHLLVNL